MLEKEFQALGLNNNEREVYLAVLQAGKASPAYIAKETGINRTTVYSVSRKLLGLGLMGEDLGAKVAYLYVESPQALEKMFAREEAALKEKKELAHKVSKELATIPSGKTYSVPKITFIEEENLEDYLYKRHDTWVASSSRYGNDWWGYQDTSFLETYKKWVDWSYERAPTLNFHLFVNDNEVEKKMTAAHAQREVRTLPESQSFDSSLWIFGDYVVMAQTRQRPHYLVEIHDAVLARNQRQLFKSLWEITK